MRTFALKMSILDISAKEIITPETINSFEKFLLTNSFRKTMTQKEFKLYNWDGTFICHNQVFSVVSRCVYKQNRISLCTST